MSIKKQDVKLAKKSKVPETSAERLVTQLNKRFENLEKKLDRVSMALEDASLTIENMKGDIMDYQHTLRMNG